MKFNYEQIAGRHLTPMISKARNWFHQTIPTDLASKVAETFSTRILLIFLSLITSILVARALGPEARGLYAVALTIGMIGVQFSNLGLHSSNTFQIAKNPELMPSLLGNSLAISFIFGSFCAVIAGLIFHFFPDSAPIQGLLLFLALLWIPFGLAFLLTQNLLIGIQEIRAFNKIEIINKVIAVVFIVLIIALGWTSAESIFAAALIAMIFCFILMTKKITEHLSRSPHLSLSIFKRNISYGIKSYLGSLITFLFLRVDLLMVDRILGKKETGFYDIAINLSEMVYLFPLVVSMLLFPKLCAIQDNRKKWELSKNVGKALLIVMLLLCGLAALVALPVVEILYGQAFLACVPAFIILTASKFIMCINSIFSNFVGSIHVPWSTIPYSFFVLGVNVALNLILIEKMGIIGAAIASSASFLLLIPFHYYHTRKHLNSEQSLSS
jgi:O-antigen/teichoic acid export membrane protein